MVMISIVQDTPLNVALLALVVHYKVKKSGDNSNTSLGTEINKLFHKTGAQGLFLDKEDSQNGYMKIIISIFQVRTDGHVDIIL